MVAEYKGRGRLSNDYVCHDGSVKVTSTLYGGTTTTISAASGSNVCEAIVNALFDLHLYLLKLGNHLRLLRNRLFSPKEGVKVSVRLFGGAWVYTIRRSHAYLSIRGAIGRLYGSYVLLSLRDLTYLKVRFLSDLIQVNSIGVYRRAVRVVYYDLCKVYEVVYASVGTSLHGLYIRAKSPYRYKVYLVGVRASRGRCYYGGYYRSRSRCGSCLAVHAPCGHPSSRSRSRRCRSSRYGRLHQSRLRVRGRSHGCSYYSRGRGHRSRP